MIHKNTVKFYKKRLVKVLALSWYLQVWSYAMTNKHPFLQQFTQVAIYVEVGMWITYFPNSSLRSYISSILLSLVMITSWSRKASVITKKQIVILAMADYIWLRSMPETIGCDVRIPLTQLLNFEWTPGSTVTYFLALSKASNSKTWFTIFCCSKSYAN